MTISPGQEPIDTEPSLPNRGDEGSVRDPVDAPESVGAWFIRLLKGILIGVGAILPGLSGGVLAVIFNVYQPLIRFLAHLREKFWKNVLYFIPIFIGVCIGIVLFAVVVDAAFGKYAPQFVCLFIGFVLGTFPALYRQAGKHGRNGGHLTIMAVSAIVLFVLMLIGGKALVNVTPNIPVWFGSGALIGLGVVVPGLSPSNFLIYFGLYDKMAAGIKDFDFSVIIPLALGLIACVLVFAKLVNWLFEKYYASMYHFILGTVIGSSLAIFPTVVFPGFSQQNLDSANLNLGGAIAFAAVLFIVGAIASYFFSKIEDRVADERERIESEA